MEKTDKRPRWLLAAWPGMGNVAVIGAGFLVSKLELEPVKELSGRGYFDVRGVSVQKGLVIPPRLPQSLYFSREEPFGNVDLTVFMSEGQPSANGLDYAHELLDHAAEMGVDRVFTFASMATQLHPSHNPAIHALATEANLLEEFQKLEVQKLEDGEIGGMNGVLLGVCAQRRMPGICLLGEIPYFGASIPNPKAARAVLDTFAMLAGAELDTSELAEHSEKVEQVLLKMMEQIKSDTTPEAAAETASPAEPRPAREKVDLATRRRIDELFDEARKDRAKAVELKQELDRLGLFEKYEDRFLDIFRRAE